jgi:adenine-specific DNA-methyltransferase
MRGKRPVHGLYSASMETRTSGEEDPAYLSEQLITCIGNKRALLGFIGEALASVMERLGKDRIRAFDVFSGSGAVSRYLKRFSSLLVANDLEPYAAALSRCYLANRSSVPEKELRDARDDIAERLRRGPLEKGFISELYAPASDDDIKPGERVFYTSRNARFIDTARRLIDSYPGGLRDFLIGPLLSEASIHANTSGVFKGFHKDGKGGLGRFGGRKGDALARILGEIALPYPRFSRFECGTAVLEGDSNEMCARAPEVDVAYLDPPYNQHPYGSNYFMLNAILEYRKPEGISPISGIPRDWRRSSYNNAEKAALSLGELIGKLKAKFLIVSFNSEGFLKRERMVELLSAHGTVRTMERPYNAFRGSRNLSARDIHVKEFLFIVEKNSYR